MNALKKFLIDLGIKVLGFAMAKALEAVPRDTVKAVAYKIGQWFTGNVTPYISERSEGEIQEIKNDFNKYLDMGMDSDEEKK